MYDFAAAVTREERIKGVNIWLGPMVNIARVPWGGRNFESFGEDPFLSSEMVRYSIRGGQSQVNPTAASGHQRWTLPHTMVPLKQGVMATVKHFVNNNQEDNRIRVSANLDDRTEVSERAAFRNRCLLIRYARSGRSIIQPSRQQSMREWLQ